MSCSLREIFGGCTPVNDRYYSGHGIVSTAKLYMRLSDVGANKVVLFAYMNRDDYKSYPAFELQTFDSLNHCKDKLVVGSSTCGERSWSRSFNCDKSYRIVLTDNVVCFNTEDGTNNDPPVVYKRTTKNSYMINNNGRIVRYYTSSELSVDELLVDDWSNDRYAILQEKGLVKNHLREGQWHIVEKRRLANENIFVKGIGNYEAGIKIGQWTYWRINDSLSATEAEFETVLY
jgi:hypothetical protein